MNDDDDDARERGVFGVSSAEVLAADSNPLSGASGLGEDMCGNAAPRPEWDGDPATMPTRRMMFSPTTVLPDLARIPEEHWADVLVALPQKLRFEATLCQGLTGHQILRAQDLADGLPPAPSDDARAALRAAPAVPAVPTAEPRPGRGRQVNVRLSASDYEMVRTAGALVGMKPTELARALIVSGARRMTYDLDRQIAAGPNG